ncbi:monooxygenase [Arcicella rigui]|uniref:Copper type II ascorbate-dependent monooxygenase C-terminal domain-containing protein n=1 Tax=Arcicella rigui TaxID=797020 RepID=A0ABU5QDD6_9BACT|nr:hypothetical protein [Arcicella rigui]MEA5140855.1 hypothetical protein [Arcicella rigui]
MKALLNNDVQRVVFIILLVLSNSCLVLSQKINFTEHIAPIIHQNCSPCHRKGESAPFSLLTYGDVVKRAQFILKVTEMRYMPPWKADHGFGEFKNVRRLTVGQIATIKVWIQDGMPEGPKEKFQLPIFEENSQLNKKPDLVLSWNKKFTLSSQNKEDYILFSLPTNLKEDTFIKSIEFRAGNKKYVHHARLSVDTTQLMRQTDAKSIDDPSIADFAKVRMKEEFWVGWVPGNTPIEYPKGTAKFLKAGSDLLLNVHYAPNNLENEQDSSVVNLYFAKDTIEKKIQTFILHEEDITNKPFEIAPDTVITFFAKSQKIPYPIHLLSVQPHLHLLGKSLRCFAITPNGEMIPLIKISKWDFNWQMTYQYKEPLLIPAESVIYAEATYDNTSKNPENRFNPPQKITYGWNSTQEMMNVIFQYTF